MRREGIILTDFGQQIRSVIAGSAVTDIVAILRQLGYMLGSKRDI